MQCEMVSQCHSEAEPKNVGFVTLENPRCFALPTMTIMSFF
jgi:hypothetical protein